MANLNRREFTSTRPALESIREVRSEAIGFTQDDIDWNLMEKRGTPKLDTFLNSGDTKTYQMGIAFISGRGESSQLGHAAVVLRESDDDSVARFTMLNDYTIQKGVEILHIRNATVEPARFLELALHPASNEIPCRYFHLGRIRITENRLRHLALTSCSPTYRVVTQDCATYARTFLEAILDFELEGDQAELEKAKKELRDNTAILTGLLGESEGASRNDPNLGESGNFSFTAATKLLSS